MIVPPLFTLIDGFNILESDRRMASLQEAV